MRSLVLVLVVAGCGSDPRALEASEPADPAACPPPVSRAGLATPGAPLAPRPAPGPATVPADPAVQLVAAASTTCAVLRSGAVACWGAPFAAPRRINGWNDVAKLAFTGGMLCALHRDDRVECGGLDAPELHGDRATVAMQTLGGTQHAVDLAVSGDAVCVREAGGSVACWVAGGPPRMVRAGVAQARALVMGGLLGPEWQFPLVSYACALVDGGRVACFDVYRQAKQDRSDPRTPADEYLAVAGKPPALHLGRPRIHKLISGATELQAPQRPDAPVCATSGGGAPRCFRLGEHAVPGEQVEPGEPPCTRRGGSLTCALQVGMASRMTVPLARERQVAVGSSHACAITEPGGVVCWGDDTYAALGRGGVAPDPLTPVLGLHDAIDVVTWTYGAVALRANGQLAYWGHGDAGDPAQTDLPITLSSITDAERIVAGHFHVCVLRRGGQVACWGAMSARSFGRHAPAEIAALHGVTALGATDSGIVARVAGGSLVHLGDPQLGATAAETPAPIAGAAHAAAIVVAGQWICILDRAPGALRCRAETKRWSTPELVVGLADVVEVAGTGPAFPEATPDALTAAGDPDLRYPTAKLVARLADGRAFEVALGIEQARPRATVSALATATTSVFASSYEVCARSAQAVSCAGADRFEAPAIPRELAGARRLSLGNPRCAVRADGQVVCFAGDLFSRGTGLGLADAPVPVAL